MPISLEFIFVPERYKEKAEETGYAITLFGRKRFLSDIKSKNRTVKSMAERVAINSPIQGTAADIIKLAMIRLDKEFQDHELNAKLLLQVHDELIIEAPDNEVDQVKEKIESIKSKTENLKEQNKKLQEETKK